MKQLSTNNGTGEPNIGENMKKIIIISSLIVLSMLAAGSPANSQTYEQAKKIQAEKALNGPNGQQIKQVVNKHSEKYGVDPLLIHAVILTESGYNPNAKSPCGATGIMQLMPATFKARGVGNNIYSIDQNTEAGVKHLAGLLAKYKGNVYLALSAYNIGGGAVDRYNGQVHPATKHYVNKVLHHKKILESVQF